eukprot:CAMPEP_0171529742 /NCGR_PEP_ID=MMETSP0959-20130129/12549_1 /TAXON_ID=87120 /ORGANISM="Aurantiochytrium limacinum, Strain ATCCMYA-1381" /LENGTH=201 /DNA_ID=CAMNT_0012072173 /DNA_START=304 /DNA_END=910 /DNA_ORIENTATION=-
MSSSDLAKEGLTASGAALLTNLDLLAGRVGEGALGITGHLALLAARSSASTRALLLGKARAGLLLQSLRGITAGLHVAFLAPAAHHLLAAGLLLHEHLARRHGGLRRGVHLSLTRGHHGGGPFLVRRGGDFLDALEVYFLPVVRAVHALQFRVQVLSSSSSSLGPNAHTSLVLALSKLARLLACFRCFGSADLATASADGQ